MMILVVLGIIGFPILVLVETIFVTNHYRTRMAKDDLKRRDFDHYWLGRSGAGYIGVKGTKMMIFKTRENIKHFNTKKLFVFTQKTRVDFNNVYLPPTKVQRYWGVILPPEEFDDFTNWLKENQIPNFPIEQVLNDVRIALSQAQAGEKNDSENKD
ncbi:hypothetical protein [Xylocopilactobacillus apis]|uniref:Uncharacterized protein n=1 Tax=Xylocopilactobacillus apis TaxID=2932183 RepID=A0AAU9DNP2_9LACO|nr:hypothetical protein [Xylocopilactobacillus apis]BDR57364.1 hypothetical protein KIMC2_19260 [Xylocopilactobacillus apis]